MNVLGSTYLPMMAGIEARLQPGIVLRAFDSGRGLAQQLADIDVLLLGHQRVSMAELDAAPRLRLIQQHGRGVDSVDLDAARRQGVTVANVPGGNSVAVAEHALALMLALAKQLHRAPACIANRRTGEPMGIELRGKTVALVGLGAAGTEFVSIARALGLRILAIRADVSKASRAPVDYLGGPDQLDAIVPQADFVLLLAALTPATAGMFGPRQFALMKDAAFLINVGRAGLVDRMALEAALKHRRIGGAAFDVFWGEPADPTDALLSFTNFILTPHVAGFSDLAVAHVAGEVSANIHRLRRGEPLVNVAGGWAMDQEFAGTPARTNPSR